MEMKRGERRADPLTARVLQRAHVVQSTVFVVVTGQGRRHVATIEPGDEDMKL